jgi:trehalose 6-phosphate synthase
MPGKDKSAQGGLAVALVSALEQCGGVWYGWSGEIKQSSDKLPALKVQDNVTFATIPIERKAYREYYIGYANRSLWPLFHCQLHEFSYDREWLTGYLKVNSRFADKLVPMLEPDDIIWVHDYHFIPLCKYLHDHDVDLPVGFFLHIPFPPYEILRAIPDHEMLLRQLCEYDLIGFQTERDMDNFVECVLSLQPGRSRSKYRKGNVLNVWGNQVRLGAYPIGIDVNEVGKMAERGRKSSDNRRLISRLVDHRDLIIGIDRLDYSKGLEERLIAYERLLQNYPAFRGKVEYLQIAAPSRTDIPEYAEVRRELNYLAGEINSRFTEYDWVPLHYLNKAFPRATVMGFLSISRVGLVTPVKDGMNLVAKEFVAAQDPDDPGVLILSSLAGAACEMTDALIVNPYDIDDIVEALASALSMSLEERKEIWHNLMKILKGNDVFNWTDTFISDLKESRTA